MDEERLIETILFMRNCFAYHSGVYPSESLHLVEQLQPIGKFHLLCSAGLLSLSQGCINCSYFVNKLCSRSDNMRFEANNVERTNDTSNISRQNVFYNRNWSEIQIPFQSRHNENSKGIWTLSENELFTISVALRVPFSINIKMKFHCSISTIHEADFLKANQDEIGFSIMCISPFQQSIMDCFSKHICRSFCVHRSHNSVQRNHLFLLIFHLQLSGPPSSAALKCWIFRFKQRMQTILWDTAHHGSTANLWEWMWFNPFIRR